MIFDFEVVFYLRHHSDKGLRIIKFIILVFAFVRNPFLLATTYTALSPAAPAAKCYDAVMKTIILLLSILDTTM